MKKILLLLPILNLFGGNGTPAQEERTTISIKASTSFCFNPETRSSTTSRCDLEHGFHSTQGHIAISVEEICDLIHEKGRNTEQNWYLSPVDTLRDPVWRVNCEEKRIYQVDLLRVLHVETKNTKDDSVTIRKLDRIDERLEAIEGAISKTRDPRSLRKGQEDLRKKIDHLHQDLDKKLKAPQSSRMLSCSRSESVYGGRDEVMVSIGGEVLRFLKIRPSGELVTAGLSEKKAAKLLRDVQKERKDPILPRIFLSVPELSRKVAAFYLQDRLIDPDLYALLMRGRNVRRISYEHTIRFIEELNVLCAGRARFALPTEDEFLVAARMIYNPIENGLKPCSALTKLGSDRQLTGLLGNVWQLTRSPCRPFGEDPGGLCEKDSYIRKGGTATSANPIECMPEYRGVAPYSVAQRDTSFRLVLVE